MLKVVETVNKEFTVELWGAQGGGNSSGKGGYTKLVSQLGNKLNNGTELYIVIGGKGTSPNGGYNGGGNSEYNGYGGGGATHVATKSGLLSSLENSKDSIIAVAGGGGGQSSDKKVTAGGNGGGGNNDGNDGVGTHGANAYNTAKGTYCVLGLYTEYHGINGCKTCCKSNSSKYYWMGLNGSFGTGADVMGTGANYNDGSYYNGAGGGGYMGGGSSGILGNPGGGAGGSGYCNTSLGTCSGSNGQQSGNGKARISW